MENRIYNNKWSCWKSINKVFADEGYRLTIRFSITYIASGNDIKMYPSLNNHINLIIINNNLNCGEN